MKARTVLNPNLPTFSELYEDAPEEIRKYIDECGDTPQSETWHPEGNVGTHIRLVYDRATSSKNIDMAMAAFFHDLGKASSTVKNSKGSWSSPGHESHSAHLVSKYRWWVEDHGANYDTVYNLVKFHMKVKLMDEMRKSKQDEMRANSYFDKLLKFSEFDNMKTLTPEELNRYK